MLSSRHASELDEVGYTLLPAWAPADLLAELRATVARLYEIEGATAGSEFRLEPGCLRLANLVDKGAVFQRVVAAPELLALVRHVIGPEFKLSSLNCRTALPGCAPQPLHADMGGVADDRGAWVCNIIWMLDAYTPDNGPVRVVPGSHRWRRLPASELPDLRARGLHRRDERPHVARRPRQPHRGPAHRAPRVLLPARQAAAAIPEEAPPRRGAGLALPGTA